MSRLAGLPFSSQSLYRDTGVFIGILVLGAAFSIASPHFLTVSNLLNIGRQTTVLAIAAFAMTYIIISGEIDLSIGPVTSLAGITAAIAMQGGGSLFLGVLAAIGTGLIFSTVTGSFVGYGRVPSFIASLGAFSIAQGVAYVLTGGRAVAILNNSYIYIFAGMAPLGIPIAIWVAVVLFVILHFVLSRTVFGAHVYAVGGNPAAARYSGLSVGLTKLRIFLLDGFLVGLAGIVLSARLGTGFVDGARFLELDAIAATVLGGTSFSGGQGALWRTLAGVLLIGILSNGLSLVNVNTYFQISIKGLIIVTAVLWDQFMQRRG